VCRRLQGEADVLGLKLNEAQADDRVVPLKRELMKLSEERSSLQDDLRQTQGALLACRDSMQDEYHSMKEDMDRKLRDIADAAAKRARYEWEKKAKEEIAKIRNEFSTEQATNAEVINQLRAKYHELDRIHRQRIVEYDNSLAQARGDVGRLQGIKEQQDTQLQATRTQLNAALMSSKTISQYNQAMNSSNMSSLQSQLSVLHAQTQDLIDPAARGGGGLGHMGMSMMSAPNHSGFNPHPRMMNFHQQQQHPAGGMHGGGHQDISGIGSAHHNPNMRNPPNPNPNYSDYHPQDPTQNANYSSLTTVPDGPGTSCAHCPSVRTCVLPPVHLPALLHILGMTSVSHHRRPSELRHLCPFCFLASVPLLSLSPIHLLLLPSPPVPFSLSLLCLTPRCRFHFRNEMPAFTSLHSPCYEGRRLHLFLRQKIILFLFFPIIPTTTTHPPGRALHCTCSAILAPPKVNTSSATWGGRDGDASESGGAPENLYDGPVDIESIIESVRAKLIRENKNKERKNMDRSMNASFAKTGESSGHSVLKEIDDNTTPSSHHAPSPNSKSSLLPGSNILRSQNSVFNDGDWYKSGYWKTKYLH
jgi:hypothetical protein